MRTKNSVSAIPVLDAAPVQFARAEQDSATAFEATDYHEPRMSFWDWAKCWCMVWLAIIGAMWLGILAYALAVS